MIDLKVLIAEESEKIDRVMREDIDRLSTTLDPLLAEILNFGLFGGGKRVRPLLSVISSRLAGRDDEDVYRLGCAFEYLHVASLFHDDVLDNAQFRRGNVSANKKFGLNGAILTGDFLLAHSMSLIGRYAGQQGLEIFTEATRGMVDGEFVQLRNSDNFNQSEEDYFTVVMGKTSLLIGASCEIGALFGGADEPKQKRLRTYGINLGTAFQIIDDCLDYLGDERVTGKAVGNDLKEGKLTLPLLIALRNGPDQVRRRLLEILNEGRFEEGTFKEVVSIIDSYDGFAGARRRAEAIIEAAVEPLSQFDDPKQAPAVQVLTELAHYVLNRQK